VLLPPEPSSPPSSGRTRARRLALVGALATSAALGACSLTSLDEFTGGAVDDAGIDGGPDSGVASSSDSGRESDGSGPIAGVPKHPPSSIRFRDRDIAAGAINGTLVVEPASDESDVRSYKVYWGSDAKTKLSVVATAEKTGLPFTLPLVGPLPPGATHLLAFSANDVGESTQAAVVGPIDNRVTMAPLSAVGGLFPSAAIDSTNRKLLVAFTDPNAEGRPALLRCELDGTSCAYHDVSAGQARNNGMPPKLLLDTIRGKLLVVAQNTAATGGGLSLLRCELDGTACTHTDLVGSCGPCGNDPSAAIDTDAQKLLIVTYDDTVGGKPTLFRCELDGTACTSTDISADQPEGSGFGPQVLVDRQNKKLLVVTTNYANARKASLFHCNLDGTSCTHRHISVNQPNDSGLSPSAMIDETEGKLLVVTSNGGASNKPWLFRCNLDGTGCTSTDISAGQGPLSTVGSVAVLDAENRAFFVVRAWMKPPSLFRCNVDGTGCVHHPLADGAAVLAHSPSPVVDPTSGTLVIAATNQETGALVRFSLGL